MREAREVEQLAKLVGGVAQPQVAAEAARDEVEAREHADRAQIRCIEAADVAVDRPPRW